MERGFYRGSPTSVVTAPRLPKRLARTENTALNVTGIVAQAQDIGLSIDFAVTIYPVKVTVWLPFVYGSTAASVLQGHLCDSANTILRYATHSTGAINGGGGILIEEIIYAAGVYSRKARYGLNSGGGSAAIYADAQAPCSIEANEFKV